MKILCVGQIVYDLTFSMNETITENRKYVMKERTECIGAPATNAAALLAKWGCDTSLIARVGDDFLGKEILDQLHKLNISTETILIDSSASTSISCILTNPGNGSRTIFNHPLRESHIEPKWPKEDPDFILIDGRETEIALRALKKYPRATSVMDAGSVKPWTSTLAPLVDYFVCSEDLSRTYTGQEIDVQNTNKLSAIFSKLAELNKKHIVITIGGRGVLYQENQKIYHVPAFKTKTIDSTGAGDIFHGAFVYFLGHNYPLETVIKLASLTASISTETMGGMISIPSLKEVMQRSKAMKSIF